MPAGGRAAVMPKGAASRASWRHGSRLTPAGSVPEDKGHECDKFTTPPYQSSGAKFTLPISSMPAAWRLLQDLLLLNVENCPDAPAVHDSEQSWSYEQMYASSRAWAHALRATGLQVGDRVALLMENSATFVAAYFGCLLCGGTVVPFNVLTPLPLLGQQLRDCAAHGLCTTTSQWHTIERLADVGALPPHVVGPDLPRLAVRNVTSLASTTMPAPVVPASIDPKTPAVIFYTSGTAGDPRGVVLSHSAMLANTQAVVAGLGLTAQDRVMQILPLSYCYGASLLHTHFMCGGSVVLDNRGMYPAVIADCMRVRGCTGFAGVASTFQQWATRSALQQLRVPTLRYMTQAGGHLAPQVVDAVRTAIAPAQFYLMYGQTEAGARLTILEPSHWPARRGSVGKPIAGVYLQISSADGTPLQTGQQGEVRVRSPALMTEYFRQPAATAAVLEKGWLRTGDLGFLDAEGYLFLEGRIAEFIKSGGHRISPRTISDALLTHPAIAEALVVGLQDYDGRESLGALLCMKTDVPSSISQIRAYIRQHLPPFMRPAALVVVPSLPRLPNGKPDSGLARQWLANSQAGADPADI